MLLLKVVLASLLFLAGAVRAQEVTGTIVGTVTDQSGGAVAGARIIVTATDQNLVVRTLESGSGGEYVAALLPVGRYSIAVDARGFKKLVRSGIELHLEEKLTIPLTLEVGAVTEEVTVVGNVAQVELQTPAASGLITGNEVREIALNNRNYLELLILMPGVTSNSGSDELPIGAVTQAGAVNSLPFSFNGGRTTGANFMVDGADSVDRGANQTLLATPSVDAIAEFKAVRGVYSAEFGRSASGQVNVITKSGTSRFHADAHEFFRNDKLAANDFFSNGHSIPRPPLRYNNFGYTLGGPVFIPGHYNQGRNKTFFFWSHEFRRVINYGSTQQSLMPTDDMKKGIFSSPVCVQYNAANTTCLQPANRIDNINPVAAAYIKDVWSKLPAGNPTDFTVFAIGRNLYNYREELIKIDQNLGPRQAISFRYLHDTVNTQEALGYQVNNPLPGIATSSTQTPGSGVAVRSTSTFSPSLLNEAGFAYSYGGKFSQSIGLNSAAVSPDIKVALPYPSTLGRIPSLSISNLTAINGFGPYVNWSRNYNWFDNLTKIRGRQTLKFGATFNYYQKSENAAANNAGSFTFSNTTRVSPTPQAMQNWANFLLGNVTSYTQTSLDLIPDMRMRQFEAYAQDDIRLRPNFTLNLGVRYSLFRLPYDDNHMLTNFDPTRWDPKKAPQVEAATGNVVVGTGDPLNGIVVNGKDSPYGDKTAGDPSSKFAPRVGFAWDPFRTGKTAIRSGYGISFDSTLVGMYENNIFTNPPYLNNITISNTRLENPSAGVTVISAAPKTLRGTPQPATLPYTQSFSFDIMRQVTSTFLLDVGYYGAKSTHLLGIVDINQVRPGAAVAAGITTANTPINSTLTPRLNILRPFLGYGPVNCVENWFNSNYNALQVSAQKRLSGNSTLRLAYSFSKAMTDATSDRANAPQNFYNRSADYARALFDRTHVLTVSYVFELPLARSSRGVAHAMLHGWQVSGVASFVTGLPLRVTSTLGLDWGGIGTLASGTQATPRPDRIADPNLNAPHTMQKWFNTQAFAAVPTWQVRPGNAPASCVIGPGYQQWDLSLMRNIRFGERTRLQIRAESFNFLNHTNPSSVATALGSSNLGNVTSAREPRRIQLALKLGF
jgi:hypothetical protein